MVKVRDRMAAFAWTKGLDLMFDHIFSSIWWPVLVFECSLWKMTHSTLSIRVSNNRFSTPGFLNSPPNPLSVTDGVHASNDTTASFISVAKKVISSSWLAWKRIKASHRELGLLRGAHHPRAPPGRAQLPSPTTVQETKEIPYIKLIHSLLILCLSFFDLFFVSIALSLLALPVPLPGEAWAWKAKWQRQVPRSWSWPRGRIIVVTARHPLAMISCCSTSFENLSCERPWFLLKLCLLPSNINARSHGCRSWPECERKILNQRSKTNRWKTLLQWISFFFLRKTLNCCWPKT